MCRSRTSGWLTVSLLVLAAAACGRDLRRPSLDDAARQYVRLAVALGERDPDSLDFYAGPVDAVADLRRDPPPLTAIKQDAGALARRVASEPFESADAERARALVADLAAIVTRVELLTGTRLSYDKESQAFFGVVPAPVDERRLAEIRTRIGALVGPGSRLVDRYAAFAARFIVPGDRLPDLMRAALDECRRRTLAHIALPSNEQVTLEFVRDKPWSAFSRYLGDARSRIQVNTDFQFTVDQVLQMACHEGYPGHHVRNTLQAPHRDESSRAPERSVQLMFTPEGLESEGSAMLAADVAFPGEDRVRFVRDRLFVLAGLDGASADRHVEVERLMGDLQMAQLDLARQYLDGGLEFARAVTALEEQALVPHAEALVKYINEYRSYVTAYTAGRRLMNSRLVACTGADPADEIRWRCFKSETLGPR
jgi:hypothetical protein